LRGGAQDTVQIQMSFEGQPTELARDQVRAVIADIEQWLAANLDTADPVLVASYQQAVRELGVFLNPNYAIPDNTIDEAGLWGVLVAPVRAPIIRSVLHPVLKAIEDGAKGMSKGLLSRAVSAFVNWGVFEQSLKVRMVEVRRKIAAGMQSHKLAPRLKWTQVLNPMSLELRTESYRQLIIEPILESQQQFSQRHIKPGDTLPDPRREISADSKIVVTQADIDAAKAMADYESRIRRFTHGDIQALDDASTKVLRIEEEGPGPQHGQRSRVAIADGPMMMSRSLAFKVTPLLKSFIDIRATIGFAGSQTGRITLTEPQMDAIRNAYLTQVLRPSGYNHDTDFFRFIVLSHVLSTNPQYAIRENSNLRGFYNALARDILDGRVEITSWDDLVNDLTNRQLVALGRGWTGNMADLRTQTEKTLAGEITQGVENIVELTGSWRVEQAQGVQITTPKSSFTQARGRIVGPPGLYEYGLISTYSFNALHGAVIRHYGDEVLKALAVMRDMLEAYVAHELETGTAGTTAARKRSDEVAYRIAEAERLKKLIAEQIQLMKEFAQATLDPEQFYYDTLRWGNLFFVPLLISPISSPWSVIRDVFLTNTVNIIRQRRTLYGATNAWLISSPVMIAKWLKRGTQVVLANLGARGTTVQRLRNSALRLIPGMSSAMFWGQTAVQEARNMGLIRAVSMADEKLLMRTAGSLFGVTGALEFEKKKGWFVKLGKWLDAWASKIPGSNFLTWSIQQGRTIVEDINAWAVADMAVGDLNRIKNKALDAFAARQRLGTFTQDPTHPGYALTPEVMGLSRGNLRQARRWLEGTLGLEAVVLSHMNSHPGATLDELKAAPLVDAVVRAWTNNYITEFQVQTLRERPPVSYQKGLKGKLLREFSTFKVFSGASYHGFFIGETMRRARHKQSLMVSVPWDIYDLFMLVLLVFLAGVGPVHLVAWLRRMTGAPVGFTVENFLQHPDARTFSLMVLTTMTQAFPMAGLMSDFYKMGGTGTLSISQFSPLYSGIWDVFVALRAAWAGSNAIKDPESFYEALKFHLGKVILRRVPVAAALKTASKEEARDYQTAANAVRELADAEMKRTQITGGVSGNPAADNVERAVQFEMAGKREEAIAELEKGRDQLVGRGITPEEAVRRELQSIQSKSIWRPFTETPTEEQKKTTLERMRPDQLEAAVSREDAIQRLSGALGGGGGGGGSRMRFGGGGRFTVPKEPKVIDVDSGAAQRLWRELTGVTPVKLTPIRPRKFAAFPARRRTPTVQAGRPSKLRAWIDASLKRRAEQRRRSRQQAQASMAQA